MSTEVHSEEKSINVSMVVSYLTNSFQKAMSSSGLKKAVRDSQTKVVNEAYKLESDFAYLIDDIVRGPTCLLTHHIAKANEFISSINTKK